MSIARKLRNIQRMRRGYEGCGATPPKNLLTGYRSYVLSRGILPTAKLWCLFEKGPQKSASSLFSKLFQKSTGISPLRGEILPETRRHCHNLFSSSLKGAGNFLRRKFPASRVSRSFAPEAKKFVGNYLLFAKSVI